MAKVILDGFEKNTIPARQMKDGQLGVVTKNESFCSAKLGDILYKSGGSFIHLSNHNTTYIDPDLYEVELLEKGRQVILVQE